MTFAEAVKRIDDLVDFAGDDDDREALAVLRRAEPLLEAVEKEDIFYLENWNNLLNAGEPLVPIIISAHAYKNKLQKELERFRDER